MVMAERPFDGSLCCSECGKVLEEFNFSMESTFVKDGAGQSRSSGNVARTTQSDYSSSRERTLDNAAEDMRHMCYGLGMDQPDGLVQAATRLYRMALEKNFTRGRRSELVQAVCVYIACRESGLPYLLIDFSIWLKINVYVVGAVYLQLCKALWIGEHHIVGKPIDPSLFIHKYTTCLSGGRNNEVSRTALRIIANMRVDWMQTGRKPSGLWGAAVYVSALAHGLKCTKSDVLRLVHVCEATLTKRLIEFENTESGSLTIEELNDKARAEEKASAVETNIEVDISTSRELICDHKGSGTPHYRFGLCKSCYAEFVDLSGGLEGGSDPPAFQRAEKERALENEKHTSLVDDTTKDAGDESDTPSAYKIDGYLLNEEEKRYKTILWERMNREYLEEQAAKEAAAKAAVANANSKGAPEELAAAELAAATEAAVANARKEKRQKRAADAENAAPAETAAEAVRRMLEKKSLGSKINCPEPEKLFAQDEAPATTKKQKLGSQEDEPEPKKQQQKLEMSARLDHEKGSDQWI